MSFLYIKVLYISKKVIYVEEVAELRETAEHLSALEDMVHWARKQKRLLNTDDKNLLDLDI